MDHNQTHEHRYRKHQDTVILANMQGVRIVKGLIVRPLEIQSTVK